MSTTGLTTAQRGYGAAHVRLRKLWAPKVARGIVPCARCHYVILKGQPWDLGHKDDDRSKWSGPEHVACNRAAGAERARFNQRVRARSRW